MRNWNITTFETINNKFQIEVVKNNFIYGFEGTAREVEKIMCQLYDKPEKAFKKLLKFAVIK